MTGRYCVLAHPATAAAPEHREACAIRQTRGDALLTLARVFAEPAIIAGQGAGSGRWADRVELRDNQTGSIVAWLARPASECAP